MVSNLALGAVALAIFHASRVLPSPFRELLLVCVCCGVLVGASLTQAPRKRAGLPPSLPKYWTRATQSGTGEEVGARGTDDAKVASASGGDKRASEILVFQGPDAQRGNGGATGGLAVAIVPGNPGLPHLYCRFAEALFQALADEDEVAAAVYVVGYPCFNTQVPAGGLGTADDGLGMLDSECSVVSQALEELERQHPGRLVVFGHSLGAWIALRHIGATKRVAMGIPPLVVAAMPYLEYSGGRTQDILRRLVFFPFHREVVNALTHFVGMVPETWVARFAHAFCDVDEQDEWMTHVLTSAFCGQPHHLLNIVLLFRSEVFRLATGFRDLQPVLESSARPRVVGLYARGDHWGPEDHRLRLDSFLAKGDKAVDLGDHFKDVTIPHAFQMNKECSNLVAKLVTNEIRNTLANK